MAANDLTTAAKVKEHLALTASDADTLLARLVTAASTAIQRYTNRDIVQQSYSEWRDGYGGVRLQLRQYPAQKPTLVQIDGVTIAERASVTGSGWVFDGNRVVGLSGYSFTRGVQNILVVYTAGWAAGSIPADIELACCELVGLVFRQRKRLGDASLTVSAGGGHETVAYMLSAMPPTTKQILDQFQEVAPPW